MQEPKTPILTGQKNTAESAATHPKDSPYMFIVCEISPGKETANSTRCMPRILPENPGSKILK